MKLMIREQRSSLPTTAEEIERIWVFTFVLVLMAFCRSAICKKYMKKVIIIKWPVRDLNIKNSLVQRSWKSSFLFKQKNINELYVDTQIGRYVMSISRRKYVQDIRKYCCTKVSTRNLGVFPLFTSSASWGIIGEFLTIVVIVKD